MRLVWICTTYQFAESNKLVTPVMKGKPLSLKSEQTPLQEGAAWLNLLILNLLAWPNKMGTNVCLVP